MEGTRAVNPDSVAPVYTMSLKLTNELVQKLSENGGAAISFKVKGNKHTLVVDGVEHSITSKVENNVEVCEEDAGSYTKIGTVHRNLQVQRKMDANEEKRVAQVAQRANQQYRGSKAVVRTAEEIQQMSAQSIRDRHKRQRTATPRSSRSTSSSSTNSATAPAASPAPSSAADIKRQAQLLQATRKEPLRDQVIHMLAPVPAGVPFKRIAERLQARKPNEQNVLRKILGEVADSKPGRYVLKRAMYSEVKVATWPGYDPALRAMVRTQIRKRGAPPSAANSTTAENGVGKSRSSTLDGAKHRAVQVLRARKENTKPLSRKRKAMDVGVSPLAGAPVPTKKSMPVPGGIPDMSALHDRPVYMPDIKSYEQYRECRALFEKNIVIYRQLDRCIDEKQRQFHEQHTRVVQAKDPEVKKKCQQSMRAMFNEHAETVKRMVTHYKVLHLELKDADAKIKEYVKHWNLQSSK